MKQYINSKPSKVENLGEEVLGAARHRNDTYDNPENRKAREFKKRSTKNIKELTSLYKTKFSQALSESTESAKDCLIEYESKKCFQSCEELNQFSGSMEEFRQLVLNTTDRDTRELLRKKYNGLIRKIRNIKFFRPIELSKYFETRSKESFRELNGKTTTWIDTSLKLDPNLNSILLTKTRAIQFGNSVPDSEREYCIYNLNLGLSWIKGLVPELNLNSLAFSFGARGNAKSVAYYQDAKKLISVNRFNEGSIVHELGHAIDFDLGQISLSMPRSIRDNYRSKLNKIENMMDSYKTYLLKPTEIFARLFEVYVHELQAKNGPMPFMLTCDPSAQHMPDLDSESIQFIKSCLSKLGAK